MNQADGCGFKASYNHACITQSTMNTSKQVSLLMHWIGPPPFFSSLRPGAARVEAVTRTSVMPRAASVAAKVPIATVLAHGVMLLGSFWEAVQGVAVANAAALSGSLFNHPSLRSRRLLAGQGESRITPDSPIPQRRNLPDDPLTCTDLLEGTAHSATRPGSADLTVAVILIVCESLRLLAASAYSRHSHVRQNENPMVRLHREPDHGMWRL